jgi:hypothetical protein
MARLRFENFMAKGVRHKFTWNSSGSRSDYYVKTGTSGYALGHMKVGKITATSAALTAVTSTGAVTGASLSISSAVSLAGIASGSAGAASGGGLFFDGSGFVKRRP